MRLPAPFFRYVPTPLLAVAICLATACHGGGPGTNLITLTGLSPKDLGPADELEIQGVGFAEGKSARVVFRGDLYRPSSRVERDVEIVARTTSSSPRSLSVAMTDKLRGAFTGIGDNAKHTTFRGDIEVAFAPNRTGSAPITGTLQDIVLDIDAPLVSETLQRQRDDEAARALAFIGLGLRGAELGGCCVVGSVEGRAQAVGLASGDVLVDLDGVTIQKEYDLVPSGRSRAARITFRRGGSGPYITRELDVQGYKFAAPSELGPALALLGCFAMWLLLWRTRLGRPLSWLTYWLALRLRESQTTTLSALRRQARGHRWLRPKWIGLPDEAGWSLIAVLALTSITALSTLLALGVDLVSNDLDLAFWVLFQTVTVIWASMLTTVSFTSKSTWATAKNAIATLAHQIPLLALTVMAVFSAHSLRVSELVAVQAASPLGCFALKNPPLLLLTSVAIVAMVPEVTLPDGPKANRSWLLRTTSGLSRLLSGTVHLWSASLLIALVAFAGYRVPWISETLQSSSLAWRCLGVILWLVKAAALLAAVAGLRFIAGSLSVRDTLPPLLRYGVGLVAIGAVLARAWSFVAVRYALGWVEDITAWMLFATTLLAVAWVAVGAMRLARSNRVELYPNPWI